MSGETQPHRLAWPTLSLGINLGRRERQLRALLRARGESGALPVRQFQVGNFPVGWTEWNDRYRDTVRAYWKGDGGLLGDLAYRITGSSDLYTQSSRRPYASITSRDLSIPDF